MFKMKTLFRFSALILAISLHVFFFAISHAHAVSPIANDPHGFQGIEWGTPLDTLNSVFLVEPDDRIQWYQFKKNGLQFANTQVESLQLLTIDGKFARVMIRYQGEPTHQAIMKYLSDQYGEIKHRRGSMVRGLNQENTWRGNETEISLNYRGLGERGFILFQSRILAPRFLEMASDHSH